MFSFMDPDAEQQVTQFEITDNGTGGGHFELDGVAQAAQTPFVVTAGQIGRVDYVAGSAPGLESITVRVSDGALWSPPASFNIQTVMNHPPAVVGQNIEIGIADSFLPTSLFYWDNGGDGPGSGVAELRVPKTLSLSGLTLDTHLGGSITYDPQNADAGPTMDFYSVQFPAYFALNPPDVAGTYVLQGRLFDGVDWGAWTSASVTLLADNAGSNFATAEHVALTSTPQTIHEWLGDSDNVDYITFTLGSAQTVNYQVDGLHGNVVQVSLYKSDGGFNGGLVPGTSNEFATQASPVSHSLSLPAGTYSVQLVAANSSNGSYDLTLSGS